MSWFKKALSLCTLQPNTYFTTVDPLEFYEWRFTQTIPGGTIFSKTLPRSDSFTTGNLVVHAKIDPENLVKYNNQWQLKNSANTEILLTVGAVYTPHDLIEKYRTESEQFSRKIARFETDAQRRIFLISEGSPAKLYRLAKVNDNGVTFESYGDTGSVVDQLHKTREALQEQMFTKKSRAKEMDVLRRYENILTELNNGTLPLDTAKLEFVFRLAGLKPQSYKSSSWEDFYLEIYPESQKILDNIQNFASKEWVKHSLNFKLQSANW